uniref:Omp-1-1 n=1 Tax=Ehrlichia ewingii TaxID=947 RepID=B1N6A3_9RICK|nr:Omp-1-1 [Ehrlichia ewingii]
MIKFSSVGVTLSLATLLSHNALSSPIPIDFSNESEMVGFYASAHYNLELPMFSPISVKYKSTGNSEADKSEKELTLFTLKESTQAPDFTKKETFNDKSGYKPVYNRNYTGFSGAVGYSGGGIRVEIEGAFTRFDVDKQKHTHPDNHRYFASCTEQEMKPAQQNGSSKDGNYVVMKNEGFKAISLTFNVCYDMIVSNSSLIPSACVGIGQGITNFLGATNIHTIFQAKLGLGFSISPKTILFANGYYVKTKDDAFTNLTVQYPVKLTSPPTHIDPVVYFHSDYCGGEVGLRFIL